LTSSASFANSSMRYRRDCCGRSSCSKSADDSKSVCRRCSYSCRYCTCASGAFGLFSISCRACQRYYPSKWCRRQTKGWKVMLMQRLQAVSSTQWPRETHRKEAGILSCAIIELSSSRVSGRRH
jgi:hypothetical protein